jgi:hypothetical protein
MENNILDIKNEKSKRIYDVDFRKKLKDKILKLKEQKDYYHIYLIIRKQSDIKLSVNKNGIYFNLNSVSDENVEEIDHYISSIT